MDEHQNIQGEVVANDEGDADLEADDQPHAEPRRCAAAATIRISTATATRAASAGVNAKNRPPLPQDIRAVSFFQVLQNSYSRQARRLLGYPSGLFLRKGAPA